MERSETVELYQRVRARHTGSVWSAPDIVDRLSRHIASITSEFFEHIEYVPLGQALDTCLTEVISRETTIVEFPELDLNSAYLSLR